MSNILAIAQKELRQYFVSPMAYALIGLFAIIYGWFFIVSPELHRAREHAGRHGDGRAAGGQHQ